MKCLKCNIEIRPDQKAEKCRGYRNFECSQIIHLKCKDNRNDKVRCRDCITRSGVRDTLIATTSSDYRPINVHGIIGSGAPIQSRERENIIGPVMQQPNYIRNIWSVEDDLNGNVMENNNPIQNLENFPLNLTMNNILRRNPNNLNDFPTFQYEKLMDELKNIGMSLNQEDTHQIPQLEIIPEQTHNHAEIRSNDMILTDDNIAQTIAEDILLEDFYIDLDLSVTSDLNVSYNENDVMEGL